MSGVSFCNAGKKKIKKSEFYKSKKSWSLKASSSQTVGISTDALCKRDAPQACRTGEGFSDLVFE